MKRWVGLLCLFSLFSVGQSRAFAAGFTVLTYNVGAGADADAEKLKHTLPLIGAKLDAFEIAGVQQCFTACELLLNASHQPTKYYFKDAIQGVFSPNSGLASLSHYPLIEVKKRYYVAQADVSLQIATKAILLMRYNFEGHIVDVYNTNMQAGDSDRAQVARGLQAAELVQFILSESPVDHGVILHGDFNMGPARPGKTWSSFDPPYYVSQADMVARTAVFSKIVQDLQLQDASDSLFGPKLDHIDRVLFRSGSNTVFHPVSWDDMSSVFVDAEGLPLSDNVPVAVRFVLDEIE